MAAFAPIAPIGAAGAAGAAGVTGVTGPGPVQPAAPGFGAALRNGIDEVSGLQHQADATTQSVATGGSAQIQDLMIATTKAQLGVDLLVQVRNRAVEAYQEIMRLQV